METEQATPLEPAELEIPSPDVSRPVVSPAQSSERFTNTSISRSSPAESLPARARAIQLECPPAVVFSGGKVEAEDGWQIFQGEQTVVLSSAGFAEGPPAERAILQESESSRRPGHKTDRWTFAGDSPSGRWLICYYGQGIVELGRRVPDTARSCRVDYRGRRSRLTLSAIRCQLEDSPEEKTAAADPKGGGI